MADAPGSIPPAYASFRTFWAFIQELHDRGPLPQILENSVFGNSRSGAARSLLLITLRFLGLMDEDRRPTPQLKVLAENPNTETLRDLLRHSYAELIALDLSTATVGQVDDALKKMGSSPSTVRKARTFFTHAASEADIALGPHLVGGAANRPATRTTTPRRARARKQAKPQEQAPPLPPTPALHPFIQGLLQELPSAEGTWTKPQRDRWLEMAQLTVDMLYRTEPED
jgi:hypothetical protein